MDSNHTGTVSLHQPFLLDITLVVVFYCISGKVIKQQCELSGLQQTAMCAAGWVLDRGSWEGLNGGSRTFCLHESVWTSQTPGLTVAFVGFWLPESGGHRQRGVLPAAVLGDQFPVIWDSLLSERPMVPPGSGQQRNCPLGEPPRGLASLSRKWPACLVHVSLCGSSHRVSLAAGPGRK